MNMKIYIGIVLVLIITTYIQVTSLLVDNEHSFYQTVQDKCPKCHGDIQVQLSISEKHSALNCTYCHQKSSTNHTNIKPRCGDCHITNLGDTLEAHSQFIPMNSDGCVYCHTNYNVITNYSRAEYIDYDISNNNGNWEISNFTTTGTLNLSYNALKKGGDHNWKSNISCVECHKDIYDAVSIGGHAIVLDKSGTQVLRHTTANYSNLTAWCTNCHTRSDMAFPTIQHAARKTTCDECHETYGVPHPGNLYTNIKTIPRLYRSLACISCKTVGWKSGTIMNSNGTLHFTVRQEPYYDIVVR